MTLSLLRDTLKKIFYPLVADIQRLVDHQVSLVRFKRVMEGHPKAKEIKVGQNA